MAPDSSVNWTRVLLLLVLGLLLVDLSWTAAVNNRVGDTQRHLDGLEEDQRVLAAAYGMNESLGGDTAANATVYAHEKASGEVVGVPVRVAAIPADGLYVDVDRTGHTAAFQASTRQAWSIAQESETPPAYRGSMVSVRVPSSWDTIGGGSAALSIATAFAGTSRCADVDPEAAATGGLTDDGSVVRVQHVEEKARAAREGGLERFVVPAGQGVDVDGIRVVEASSFGDAADHLLRTDEACRRRAQNQTGS